MARWGDEHDEHDRQNGLWVMWALCFRARLLYCCLAFVCRTCCKGTLGQVCFRGSRRTGLGGSRHAPWLRCAVLLMCLVHLCLGHRDEGRVGMVWGNVARDDGQCIDLHGYHCTVINAFRLWPAGSSCRVLGNGGAPGLVGWMGTDFMFLDYRQQAMSHGAHVTPMLMSSVWPVVLQCHIYGLVGTSVNRGFGIRELGQLWVGAKVLLLEVVQHVHLHWAHVTSKGVSRMWPVDFSCHTCGYVGVAVTRVRVFFRWHTGLVGSCLVPSAELGGE